MNVEINIVSLVRMLRKSGFREGARGMVVDMVTFIAKAREQINEAEATADVQRNAIVLGEALMELLADDDGAKLTALLAAYRQQPDTFAIALRDCLAEPPPG